VKGDWHAIPADYRKLEPLFQVFEIVKTDFHKELDELRKESKEMKQQLATLEGQSTRFTIRY